MITTTERFKLRSTMAEPDTGWQVRNPEDGHLIRNNTYHHTLEDLKAYRISKNYPIGSQFEADIQNWMCQDLDGKWCEPVDAFNPETATVAQKAVRFARAIAHWAKAGFPLVSKEIREERMATCQACPYYLPEGNAGLGQCTAPGCGCTSAKLWLETSQCKHPGGSKWKR